MNATQAQYGVAREMFRGCALGNVDEAYHAPTDAIPEAWTALSLNTVIPLTWAPLAAEKLVRLAIESCAYLTMLVDHDTGEARFTLLVSGPPDVLPAEQRTGAA